jgi:hypothetical protein
MRATLIENLFGHQEEKTCKCVEKRPGAYRSGKRELRAFVVVVLRRGRSRRVDFTRNMFLAKGSYYSHSSIYGKKIRIQVLLFRNGLDVLG